MTLFLIVNLITSGALANLIYIEISNSGLTSSSSNLSPSTAVIISAGGIQLLSSICSLIALAYIKDPEIGRMWAEHSLSFVIIIFFCFIDSNFFLIMASQMFTFSVFQAKFTS